MKDREEAKNWPNFVVWCIVLTYSSEIYGGSLKKYAQEQKMDCGTLKKYYAQEQRIDSCPRNLLLKNRSRIFKKLCAEQRMARVVHYVPYFPCSSA